MSTTGLSVVEGTATHAQATDKFRREAKGIATSLQEKMDIAGDDAWAARAALLAAMRNCGVLVSDITRYVADAEENFHDEYQTVVRGITPGAP